MAVGVNRAVSSCAILDGYLALISQLFCVYIINLLTMHIQSFSNFHMELVMRNIGDYGVLVMLHFIMT